MTEEQLGEFMSFVIGSYEQFSAEDVRILLAVEHKTDKRLIGWCGVFPNDMLEPHVREVAYAISKDYRNLGLATEAVNAIMGFVFGQTKLDTVTGIVKLHNPTSKRVLEKAGFVHVRQVKLADGEMYFELERRKTVRAGEPGIGAKHDVCLRRAVEEDTETLAAIMKKTFDREIEKWLAGCEQEAKDICVRQGMIRLRCTVTWRGSFIIMLWWQRSGLSAELVYSGVAGDMRGSTSSSLIRITKGAA